MAAILLDTENIEIGNSEQSTTAQASAILRSDRQSYAVLLFARNPNFSLKSVAFAIVVRKQCLYAIVALAMYFKLYQNLLRRL